MLLSENSQNEYPLSSYKQTNLHFLQLQTPRLQR